MPRLLPPRLSAAALILSLGLAGLPAPAQTPPLPSVTVRIAAATDYTLTTRLPGRIKASTVAEVRPQVSGIIRARLFEEGAAVAAGQPLYKIEDETYAAAVAAARAAVAQAQANYDLSVLEARRAEDLFGRSAGSAQSRDNALAARATADAALQLAQAQLMSAEIDLDRTTIRAPVSGVIGLSQTTTGALVGAQQAAALATIRALDPIHVDVTQSATDLLRWTSSAEGRAMRASGEARLTLANGAVYPLTGELRAAEPQVEPTTGMITLRISFANPDRVLIPGMYVEVELPQAVARGAVLVPQEAVMRDRAGGAHVWVVRDGQVAVRDLTILTAAGHDWVATGGLAPGEAIITSGFQKIAPGAPVTIAAEAGGDASPPGGEGAAKQGTDAPEPASGARRADAAGGL